MVQRAFRLPSQALRLLLAAAVGGCASTPAGPIWTPLEDPPLQAYAQALACRVAPRCGEHPVLLVDLPGTQAEALPDGRIAIRRGMLLALEEEAELAFVIAHEIAHRRLGHRAPQSLQARLPLELAADAHALEQLRRLGYPDDAPARLIERIRPSRADDERHRIAHQQIDARLAALPPATGREAAASAEFEGLLQRYRSER